MLDALRALFSGQSAPLPAAIDSVPEVDPARLEPGYLSAAKNAAATRHRAPAE